MLIQSLLPMQKIFLSMHFFSGNFKIFNVMKVNSCVSSTTLHYSLQSTTFSRQYFISFKDHDQFISKTSQYTSLKEYQIKIFQHSICQLYSKVLFLLVTASGLEPTTSRVQFESSCSHLNFRFHACFEQGVP